MWEPKYQVNEEVYVFMTWGSFQPEKGDKITFKNLLFLAKARVRGHNLEKKLYLLNIEEFLLDRVNMEDIIKRYKEGCYECMNNWIPIYSYVWVENGEEAYKVFSNPSLRWRTKKCLISKNQKKK